MEGLSLSNIKIHVKILVTEKMYYCWKTDQRNGICDTLDYLVLWDELCLPPPKNSYI